MALYSTLLHSEALPLSDSHHVLLPSTPCSHAVYSDCHTALHGPGSSWDCRRVLHKTPPNELDRHDPSGRGLHSSRCTGLNCEVLCIVQLCFTAASTESAQTKSDVVSQAMHGVSLLRNCSLASNSAASLLTKSRSILGQSQELWFLLTCCEQASNCNHLSHASDMADVSPSPNNRACPLHHFLALNMKANFIRLAWSLNRAMQSL